MLFLGCCGWQTPPPERVSVTKARVKREELDGTPWIWYGAAGAPGVSHASARVETVGQRANSG
jgi:hypothetical protein